MTDTQIRPTLGDPNEVYLRSIDATLAYIAERLPPLSRSSQTYWLSIANAAALWSVVAILLVLHFG